LQLSIPGTFQLCAEWWALEVMALFAGHFGTDYVSAFTVTLNAIGVFARLPLGISFSAAVLVGNKLGASRPRSAKIIYDSAVILSIVSGLILSLLLIFANDFFAGIYTHSDSVKEIVSGALPYAGIYFFFYAYQRASAGACRGAGRQNIGAAIYITAYYFIGMPIGVWFGISGFLGSGNPMKLKGLWTGAAISAVIGSVFFLFFRLWINWDKEVERALHRIQIEQNKMKDFKDMVEDTYGDQMGDGVNSMHPGLQEDDDFDYIDEHRRSHHSLSNLLSQDATNTDIIVDQIEDDFDEHHNPMSNIPHLAQNRNQYSGDMSDTHSMPSNANSIQKYSNASLVAAHDSAHNDSLDRPLVSDGDLRQPPNQNYTNLQRDKRALV
jgi:hypothetical protein